MKVTVKFYKSEKLILSKDTDVKTFTIADLKNDISLKVGVHKSRIGIKASKRGKLIKLKEGSPLSDIPCDEPDNLNLYFIDLGPQLGYRTAFIIEYLSSLIPYLVMYMLLEKHQLNDFSRGISSRTRLAALCWIFHFVKRMYESIYVHKFSNDTMPVMNGVRNFVYYGFFGVLVGYFVNQYSSSLSLSLTASDVTFSSFFFFFAYCNWCCHNLVAGLRKSDGDLTRSIPRPTGKLDPTLLYHLISYPNYFYEILTWISFTLLTKSYTSALFTLTGGSVMTMWALEKHAVYKKDSNYPKQRKGIIPFIL